MNTDGPRTHDDAEVILVVEDELVNRLLLQRTLERAGYQIVLAHDGEEALIAVEHYRPDLILMDVMMPKMDGFEAIRHLRNRPATRQVPIILLTCLGEMESKIRGLDAGANDYLVKPFDVKELLARVRATLRADAGRQAAVELADMDPLLGEMGVYSRRFFDRMLEEEFTRSARYGEPLALLLIDIDRFKHVNDTHGHEIGDRALIAMTGRIVGSGRSYEHLCRYGGEEFALLLPQTTLAQAAPAAERIRRLVGETPFRLGDLDLSITISIGVAAVVPTESDRVQRLVRMADRRLYAAKAAGRNCTVSSDAPEGPRRAIAPTPRAV
jgi:diguanylate cyclase (GGDEF)-like protein